MLTVDGIRITPLYLVHRNISLPSSYTKYFAVILHIYIYLTSHSIQEELWRVNEPEAK